ncbi:MAG: single-stranded-DNA-specific exonuclease RecJ [Campylobacteraceae bacterium]|jgi:single-stranded-DNA-specific exonuclease|nr:single-stranded-DNA-specific exonuclease RecJ [Campylobacteraceae bacterium]
MQNKVLTKKDLVEILESRFKGDVVTSLSKLPHPHTMPNSEAAAKRVKLAIENKEKITIVGDYDVDGVTSAAILEEFLQKNGAEVETIIPSRFSDGYGLGVQILERISSRLIITVDNGIAAFEAAKECKKRGIELIVIDHHTIGETLPEALAIVHPKLDNGFVFGDICAAAVVWYFMASLKLELNSDENLKEYLDLVAIATIADVMPLKDINRTLVKAGIEVIKNSKRPAIRAIKMRLAKEEFSSTDIAYKISPRLNSAGRLVLAKEAFSFLRAKTLEEAASLFDKLDALNEERKKIELSVTNEAMEMADRDAKVIVVAKEGWHEGVVGIVASRLAHALNKPAIVFNIENGHAKGSARSAMDINIFELISKNSHLLSNFGGHKMAAGVSLSVDNLEEFKRAINECCPDSNPDRSGCPKYCLGEIDFCEIDEELVRILDEFEPYGEANEKPIFMGTAKKVVQMKTIGQERGFKLTIEDGSKKLKAVCFRANSFPKEGEDINFRFSIYKNDYLGGSLELLIEEVIAS